MVHSNLVSRSSQSHKVIKVLQGSRSYNYTILDNICTAIKDKIFPMLLEQYLLINRVSPTDPISMDAWGA